MRGSDRAYGPQFKARFLETSAPSSIDGIEKYLGSGTILGIAPVDAKKMVKAFGEKASKSSRSSQSASRGDV
jgi:exodeoxyribonuclease V alpha subunit